MPRWLEIILGSVIAGAVTSACAVVINLTGGPAVLISLAAIFMAFGVSGIFRES